VAAVGEDARAVAVVKDLESDLIAPAELFDEPLVAES
jgi:hypothetical protein